ncbi:hypothetical protein BDN67DRAFT_1018170 [Paxillus ammoniavirescens]|nr:hypothetical protein BDN67DRAFT_1018170 [Paxillus ammoniavirescens]
MYRCNPLQALLALFILALRIHVVLAQPKLPGSASGSGASAASPNPVQTFTAPAPGASSAVLPPSSVSVNSTPFGGSLIPSDLRLSVSATLSSTAGFPTLTGYLICGKTCHFLFFSCGTYLGSSDRLALAASAGHGSRLILHKPRIPRITRKRACTGNLDGDLSQNLAQQYCNLGSFATSLSFLHPPAKCNSLPTAGDYYQWDGPAE